MMMLSGLVIVRMSDLKRNANKYRKMSSNLISKEKYEDKIVKLQLGDIIQIINDKNERLNNQIFIIDYIDRNKIILINTDTLDKLKLSISDDGLIGDGL